MSITISWWHIPACITVTWLVVLFWPQRSAWDTIAHGFVVVVALIPVLLVWIASLLWRLA